MIDHVDRMLLKIVHDRVDAQLVVSFEPPDKDWRTQRRPADRDSLSIYLVDLRENRALRSNERTRTVSNGQFTQHLAPRMVDCHYLASAWSRAKPSAATTPTLDEHALLHRLASVLANTQPLAAARVYATEPLPVGFPAALVGAEMPVTLLPPEGYPKLAELWGTMGDGQPLKPVVYFTVTVPLLLESSAIGPMVTTAHLQIHRIGDPGAGDNLFDIAGSVLDTTTAPPTPIAETWVDLLDQAGGRQRVERSDAAGRFVFGGLAAGTYKIRAVVAGFAPVTRPITVPAADGRYDLLFAQPVTQ